MEIKNIANFYIDYIIQGAILIARRAQRKCLKYNQNAITLVALVITIIVLLILAGVTINLTLGERGIFRLAEKAAKNYQDSQQEEMYGLNSLQNEINDIIGNLGNDSTVPNIPVTNIEITPNSDTIMVNETVQLTAKVLPNNATNKDVKWDSSNKDVATVDQEGNVTAIAAGTTTIIATANDGSGVTGSASVKVNYPAYTVGQTVTVGGVSYYVMADSGVAGDRVALLRASSYGFYQWGEACSVGINYASSLGYTSAQATSRLLSKPEAEALSSSIRTTGSIYWTSSQRHSTSSWFVNGGGNFEYIATSYSCEVRPVLFILKSLI